MKKKKDKSTGKKIQKPVEEKKVSTPERFDYGGIPARDLKKNLGCG